MGRWHLGLHPSSIQDGTYTDFHRGQQAQFAVAFGPESWDRSNGPVAAVRVEDHRYDLVARVEAIGEESCLLDCGLLVGCAGRPPPGVGVGQLVGARGVLELSRRPEPGLVHTWFVERVFHRTDERDELLGLDLYGGPEQPGWEELGFTEAWRDDDGRADYLLECLLADDAGMSD